MYSLVVHLDPFERETAERYGTQISWYAEQHGLKDMKQDFSKDSKQLNIDASIVEHRFAKHMNVYPNFQLDGPTHVDVIINGHTVDVKWTDNPGHNLAVRGNITLANAADIFALMRGQAEGDMEYCGWIGKDDFFEKADVKHGQSGLPYRVCWVGYLNQGPIPEKEL